MQIDSPLTNLCNVLETVEQTAKQHKSLFQHNEDATRAALIDPVLHALGWNTGNVAMVVVEKVVPNGGANLRADYALYGRNGEAVVVIEAKSPGTNLQSHFNHMVSYALAFHVTSVFLTDGLVWHHFATDSVNSANFAPNVTHDISKATLPDMAVYLIQHLDAAHFWPKEQSVDALAQDVGQLQSELATLQRQMQILLLGEKGKPTPKPTAVVRQPPLLPESEWVELDALADVTKTKPTHLRLPDEHVMEVKYWRNILIECCKYVLARSPDVAVPLPDYSAKNVRLLDFAPPPNGLSYIAIEYQGNKIFIRVHYDANNCVKNAIHILKLLPASHQDRSAAVIYS